MSWLGLVLVVAWAATCLALAAMQERLVFQPRPGLAASPADHGLAFEDVQLSTADGVRIHGWYLPGPADSAARHVLFLHGNGGNLGHVLPTLATLQRLGHPVFAIDYRGYGASAGTPSEDGTHRDALAAWAHLVEDRGLAADDIVVYGQSLGGAIAARLAATVEPHGLVLESTFSRLADVAAYRYPWAPVGWLLRVHYDTVARLAEVRCPVLVAHSPTDEVVPYALGRRLRAAVRSRVTFVELRGGHNQAFRRSGADYHARLHAFIGARAG